MTSGRDSRFSETARKSIDLRLADGRNLQVRVSGPAGGLPLIFHHGTPGSLPSRGLERAAHARGLRLVSFPRPGYGLSSRKPGRKVADVVDDTAAVLESLGVDRCLLVGWSGGGPHALACAARLPQTAGVLVVAGLAPSDADDLAFTRGMDEDNREEWRAVFAGEDKLRAYVEPIAPQLMGERLSEASTTVEVGAPGDVEMPIADRDALVGEFGDDLTAASRDGLQFGIDGWIDDELAFSKPWGFNLQEITLPVSVWHGFPDVNVPVAHGRWLAENLPVARLHVLDSEGHLSVMKNAVDAMLDDLVASVGAG